MASGLSRRKSSALQRHVHDVRNAKPPFAAPEAVLAYLSRCTHRVAISNRRLIAFDETGVTFRYKDYRRDGPERQRVMTLASHEFIRRFLLHVLPHGFHRIRHYGLLATSARKASIAHARELLAVALPLQPVELPEPLDRLPPCPCCGGRMIIIETFERWRQPRAPPHAATPPFRPTPTHTPFDKIRTTGVNISRSQLPIHGPPGEEPHSPSRRRSLHGASAAITTARQIPKSP
jgi:Putative transposase